MSIALVLVVLVAAQTPDLAGIDTVPSSPTRSPPPSSPASASSLLTIALDARIDDFTRARAIRRLGAVPATSTGTSNGTSTATSPDAIDLALTRLSTSTSGELAVQVALARFDRAVQRSRAAAVAVATSTMASSAPALRAAGALMWWRLGGEDAHLALEHGRHDVDAGVRAACVARLRWWSRAGGSTSTSTNVLQQNHDAGPPAPARR